MANIASMEQTPPAEIAAPAINRAARVLGPLAAGLARVPPSTPWVLIRPERLRSPPTSRSQSGRTSPSAENRPCMGFCRAIARRSGEAEAQRVVQDVGGGIGQDVERAPEGDADGGGVGGGGRHAGRI